jgi:hypothetical protein
MIKCVEEVYGLRHTKTTKTISLFLVLLLLMTGCSQAAVDTEQNELDAAYTDAVTLEDVELEDEMVALSEKPAQSIILSPVASGKLTQSNKKAVIDYSNMGDGYVMVKYTATTTKRLKVQVKGPTTTYTYNLTADKEWETFPLSDGNGNYQVTVYENVSGTKYSTVLSASFKVILTDEFAPFIRPNQYVNYENATKTIAKAEELTAGKTEVLDKVQAVYDYVVTNITYDKKLAATVQSGYLPDLDSVLEKKTGICFDYAALMAGMLRSQGVPCKLVVGYAGKTYHSWISVYSEDTGWVDGVVFFDGDAWQRMDPTFASSGKQSASIMKYIGNEKNYTAKYLY